MTRSLLLLCLLIAVLTPLHAQQSGSGQPAGQPSGQPWVKLEPPQLDGSRPIEKQTQAAVLRDYLQSWQNLSAALDGNDMAPLDLSFVGVAREKLGETVAEQTKAGLRSHYRAISHDIQFVFYSPEGQSIQLIDTVVCEQQVFAKDKALTTQQQTLRYLVVMTPAEVQWRVRIFQALANK